MAAAIRVQGPTLLVITAICLTLQNNHEKILKDLAVGQNLMYELFIV